MGCDPDYMMDSWREQGFSYGEISAMLEGMADGAREACKDACEECKETGNDEACDYCNKCKES